jgi:hypothetical protein
MDLVLLGGYQMILGIL